MWHQRWALNCVRATKNVSWAEAPRARGICASPLLFCFGVWWWFETGFLFVAQAILGLALEIRLALNLLSSSCPCS